MNTKSTLVIGLGVSGLSVVRHLKQLNLSFDVADKWQELPESVMAKEPALRGADYYGGPVAAEFLSSYERVVVSPGVPTRTAVFEAARAAGVQIIGDVELFALETQKPVVAVTGSNGKSTVVSMIGEILKAADVRVAVVGNVGVACLDGLDDEHIDVYVLELSSFQLETTHSLKPHVACVLNVCEDHLDRYDGIEDYASVKRRIYRHAAKAVFNVDDERTRVEQPNDAAVSFSMNTDGAEWTLDAQHMCGPDDLKIDASVLKVVGSHNQCNALAAMAIVCGLLDKSTGELTPAFISGLSAFSGLPHRSEYICTINGVSWFNDSKGTNVGACISAIEGMDCPVILIAGGRGKNADYSPMREIVVQKCRAVVLIGEEAENIHASIGTDVPAYFESSMHDAVSRATLLATPGDCVLLSPACSSFDMFENFEARGLVFSDEVRKLCA